jgi:hypothetical protein
MCLPEMYEKVKLNNVNEKALEFCDSIKPGWTGMPWDCQRNDLKTLYGVVDNDVSHIVKDFDLNEWQL